MTKAWFTFEPAAIHRQHATDDECHPEDIHRQLIDEIVQTVVKVVRPIVGYHQQCSADRQHDEPAKQKQVKQSAERFAMNTFLRQRILGGPPHPLPASRAQIRPPDLYARATRAPRPATRARRYSPRS